MKSVTRKLFDWLRLYKAGIFKVILNRLFPEIFTYRTFILYRFDLKKYGSAAPQEEVPFSIKKIQSHQDELFKQFRKKFPAGEFVSRIKQKGKVCYVALKKGKVAGYSWVTDKELLIDSINYTYSMKDDEVFIYSCFVSKEHRGEGIYPAMLRQILKDHSKANKYNQVYIGVLSANAGSIRGIEKAGFKRFNRISYAKWLNNEKWWGLMHNHYIPTAQDTLTASFRTKVQEK